MFSSTYHDSISNPFPNFPSSSYPTLPFLIDPENDHFVPNNNINNTTLLDDLPPPFNIPTTHDAPIFPTEEETVSNLALVADHCTAMFEQDASNNGYCAAANYVSNINSNSISFPNFLNQKPAIAKKDRHSKIHTSQGLRDRRVRLSSEIARKFFDLQDMLEFDKPSNTLEWLFTKSENAIKELARSKQHHSGGEIEKEEVDQDYSNNYNNKSLTGGGDGCSSKGRKQLKWTQREETKKESRERARARARERTCYKRVQELEERCPVTAANTTHQMLNQLMSSSSSSPPIQPPYYNPPHHLLDSETLRDLHGFNVIEESIMIKRNMMSSHQHHHHHHQQQNLAIPNKEPSFNNNVVDYPLFPYSTTPNWEANGFSNFYGIATMNLSTCFMNQW